jgi:hypothetical protein
MDMALILDIVGRARYPLSPLKARADPGKEDSTLPISTRLTQELPHISAIVPELDPLSIAKDPKEGR